MRIRIQYSDGLKHEPIDVTFDRSEVGVVPIELLVPNCSKGKADEAVQQYIKVLSYTFMQVRNLVINGISKVRVEHSELGVVEKDGAACTWTSYVDKVFFVNYHVSVDGVREGFYYADSVVYGDNNRIKPKISTDLIVPSDDVLINNVKKAIGVIASLKLPYLLKFNNNIENPGVHVYRRGRSRLEDRRIRLDDIEEDDIYVLFKLIMLIITKGHHMGVIFLDCKGLSKNMVLSFAKVCEYFFGDGFLYVYNCENCGKLNTNRLELKNIWS